MALLRLYKFSPGFIEFWFCSDFLLFHQICQGKVGELGKLRSLTKGLIFSSAFKAQRKFRRLKQNGYAEVPEGELQSIFVRYDKSINFDVPVGEPADLDHRLHDAVFWTGCAVDEQKTDEGQFAKIGFKVIDVDVAKRCLLDELSSVNFPATHFDVWAS